MSYFKYIEQRKKGVSDYIDTVEDYTVLTETEQVVYDHFKSKYPELDWILKKRIYHELSDLVNEGTEKFCRYYDDFSEYLDGGIKNNISPYYKETGQSFNGISPSVNTFNTDQMSTTTKINNIDD